MSTTPRTKRPALFEAWGYSDDCAGFTGVDDDEYQVCRSWYDFEVDGVVVGRCRMWYSDGKWAFQVRPLPGHALRAMKRRRVRK